MAYRVVLGYDGSPCARAAPEVALNLVTQLEGKLFVVYAYQPAFVDPSLTAAMRREGREITKAAVMAAGARGVRTTVELVAAPTAAALLSVAEKRCADLLVVGTRSESPLLGVLLGSTCYRLLHSTKVPLVVVPPPHT